MGDDEHVRDDQTDAADEFDDVAEVSEDEEVDPTFVRQIEPNITLHRDPATGIAWVANGRAGVAHSAHPNIDATGDYVAMMALGDWPSNAEPVKSHGFVYNINCAVVSDKYDRIADAECRCGGVHQRDSVGGTASGEVEFT